MKTKSTVILMTAMALLAFGGCRKQATQQTANNASPGTPDAPVGGGAAQTGTTYYFRGNINGDLSIEMVLLRDGVALPDTLVGTDSHTTMINGLGVLGWGVGGIEAEAAMLGQPISMLIPQVVGFKLYGKMQPGATATDLVLTVTQMLRKKGVVGKFVEFFGEGISSLSLADRATIANMSPEYGATMGYFPVDAETLNYLRFTGRSASQVALVEAYCREQGIFHTIGSPEPLFSDMIELDLGAVEPSIAGPKRPQDRVALSQSKPSYRKALVEMLEAKGAQVSKGSATKWIEEGGNSEIAKEGHDGTEALKRTVHVRKNGAEFDLTHGSVVIAAITSCTNTSNPSVLLAAGLPVAMAIGAAASTSLIGKQTSTEAAAPPITTITEG